MPYLNVDEVEAALSALASPPNNGFTQLITLSERTWENRLCHAIKVADGSQSNRVGIYLLGGVHAREWGSPDILISFLEQLTYAYRSNTSIAFGEKRVTAAEIQSIVKTKDIVCFPQANPDGRQYSMTIDPDWRMNRRPAAVSTPQCPGVDINRNYDFLWKYKQYFSSEAAIANSINPCSADQTYIGSAPCSEPETRNVVSLFDMFPNIRYFVDLHSYAEKILYSWGDDEEQTVDPEMNFKNATYDGKRGIIGDTAYKEHIGAADQIAIIGLATQMRNAIAAVRGREYGVEPAVGLYPTAGAGDDYAFSRHIADNKKAKVYSYTIEWGRQDNMTPFHPRYSEMQQIIEEISAGLFEFCLRAGGTGSEIT